MLSFLYCLISMSPCCSFIWYSMSPVAQITVIIEPLMLSFLYCVISMSPCCSIIWYSMSPCCSNYCHYWVLVALVFILCNINEPLLLIYLIFTEPLLLKNFYWRALVAHLFDLFIEPCYSKVIMSPCCSLFPYSWLLSLCCLFIWFCYWAPVAL